MYICTVHGTDQCRQSQEYKHNPEEEGVERGEEEDKYHLESRVTLCRVNDNNVNMLTSKGLDAFIIALACADSSTSQQLHAVSNNKSKHAGPSNKTQDVRAHGTCIRMAVSCWSDLLAYISC